MFKNITKILSSHIIVKGLGLANIAIILTVFSVKEFGEYSYLLLLLHLIAVIIDPFLSSYLVDFKSFNYKKYNFGIIIVSVILSPFVYAIFKQLNVELTVQLFFLFSGTYIISAGLKSFLNVKERYLEYGLVDVIRQTSIFLSTLFFFYIYEQKEYIQLLELNYLISFISMSLLAVLFIKAADVYFDYSFVALKKLIVGSKYLILYIALVPFIAFIDSYFVERYLTEQDLGLYSFSLKIYNISLMLVVPIFTVLNIKQIEIAQKKEYSLFFKKNVKKTLLFSTTIFMLSIVLNWAITHYVFTEYKASFLDTTILLCAAFFSYTALPFSFLLAYRKYKWLFILVIVALFTNIGVNYFFIEIYGTRIAALSTLLAQTIISLGAAILSYYILGKE